MHADCLPLGLTLLSVDSLALPAQPAQPQLLDTGSATGSEVLVDILTGPGKTPAIPQDEPGRGSVTVTRAMRVTTVTTVRRR